MRDWLLLNFVLQKISNRFQSRENSVMTFLPFNHDPALPLTAHGQAHFFSPLLIASCGFNLKQIPDIISFCASLKYKNILKNVGTIPLSYLKLNKNSFTSWNNLVIFQIVIYWQVIFWLWSVLLSKKEV